MELALSRGQGGPSFTPQAALSNACVCPLSLDPLRHNSKPQSPFWNVSQEQSYPCLLSYLTPSGRGMKSAKPAWTEVWPCGLLLPQE